MLGTKIRELRKAAKIKQYAFANSLGISRITLWRLETNQPNKYKPTTLTAQQLEKAASILNTSISELVQGDIC